MEHPTAVDHGQGSSYAPALRRRADALGELSQSIERSIVMTLGDGDRPSGRPPSPHERMCLAMLERNLHQLHRAADDLRATAMRFRERADEFEAAIGRAA